MASGAEGGRLEYAMLDGPCRTGEVVLYLDALAEEAEGAGREVVVVLDNAPFHTAKAVKERRPEWEAKGLNPKDSISTTCPRTARI